MLPTDLAKRYLQLLGAEQKKPSLGALRELVAAHVVRVPCENVSTLYHRVREGLLGLPDLDRHLDGIERHNVGGVCYTLNHYFGRLLSHIGYDVTSCADAASIVALEGREYLVDVGHAAPLLDPLPLDLASDYVLAWGRDRLALRPRTREGCPRVEFYHSGRLELAYSVDPAMRSVEFSRSMATRNRCDQPFSPTDVALARFFPRGRSVAIRDLALIESAGTRSRVRPIGGCEGLARAIEQYFEIPARIVEEALAPLDRTQLRKTG